MIQRIQSLWLFIAALTAFAMFYFDVYSGTINKIGNPFLSHLRIDGHLPSLLFAILSVILPAVAIFFFKNRKSQKSFIYGSALVMLLFISLNMIRISNFIKTNNVTDGSYGISSVLPVFYLVLLILALNGIGKDDKLVKSMDRLR